MTNKTQYLCSNSIGKKITEKMMKNYQLYYMRAKVYGTKGKNKLYNIVQEQLVLNNIQRRIKGMKRKWFKRSQLDEVGIRLEVDENGEYSVYNKNGLKLKPSYYTAKHKYGKTKTYVGYSVYLGKIDGKFVYANILEHVLVWLWFKGDIPEGYDVDHIDNDVYNNNIDNLQLLTRKENLAKRGVGRNQYTAHLSDEEILAKREEKKNVKLEAQQRIFLNKINRLVRLKETFEERKDNYEYELDHFEKLSRKFGRDYQETIEDLNRRLDYANNRLKEIQKEIHFTMKDYGERVANIKKGE